MLGVLTATTLVSCITQVLVTFHIYKIGRKNLSYLLFFALSLVTLAWALLNYLSITMVHSTYLTLIIRSIMFFAVVQVALFYVFSHKFPKSSWNESDRHFMMYGWLVLAVGAIALSPLLFRTVEVAGGVVSTNPGSGLVVFVAFVVLSVFFAFRILLQKIRTANGLYRTQLVILLFAAILNWLVIPFTNFIITLIFRTTLFAALSPVYSLIFSGIIAYALARHHLFDIKKSLRDSIIHVDYILKNQKNRAIQYYELQTLVYESTSNYVALDFSDVEDVDQELITIFNELRNYMETQGKQVYFIGYSKKVFYKLRPIINLQMFYSN